MTRYAYDPTRRSLLHTYDVGDVPLAKDVAAFDEEPDVDAAGRVAQALTELSRAMWAVYDRPTGAGIGDVQEEFATESDLTALAEASGMVLDPRRPDAHGYLIQSYTAINELANVVGRCLDRLPPSWRALVADDVAAEADAVRRAELGDFAGRAVQAVWRDRPEVNPALLDAALRLVVDDPDVAPDLPEQIGVMAAAAATLAVTHAAALVAADRAGLATAAEVFAESDNLEACSVQVPTLAIYLLEEGLPPAAVVTGLVREALAVRQGRIPDLECLLARLQQAEQEAHGLTVHADEWGRSLMEEASRLTPLDTARPAADLWEHLLDGIGSARVLHREYLDDLVGPYPDQDTLDDEAHAEAEAEWERRFTDAEASVWSAALRQRLRESCAEHLT